MCHLIVGGDKGVVLPVVGVSPTSLALDAMQREENGGRRSWQVLPAPARVVSCTVRRRVAFSFTSKKLSRVVGVHTQGQSGAIE